MKGAMECTLYCIAKNCISQLLEKQTILKENRIQQQCSTRNWDHDGPNTSSVYLHEFTFASALTSQSFASILAVSEESGGQEDSRFDKPKSGAGSSASWKVAVGESIVKMIIHKECGYRRRVIFWWWQGWCIFTYFSDLFHGGQTVVLAGCYGGWRPKSCEVWYITKDLWLKVWKGH